MQKILKALDGYKRIIMVVIFAAAAAATIATGQDYGGVVRTVLSVFGWDPADAAVTAGVVATFVGALWAIIDGLRKKAITSKSPEA